MILLAITALLATGVLSISACRLIHMHVRTHKPVWLLMFLGFCWGAVAAIGEVTQGRASWAAIPLLAGALLYLVESRLTWRDGPPSFTEK